MGWLKVFGSSGGVLFWAFLSVASASPCSTLLLDEQLTSVSLPSQASEYVYFFIGPANAGKGTISKPLARKLGINYVSTGDVLRAEIASGSELGLRLKPIVESGRNIQTEDLEPFLEKMLDAQTPDKGFILDGSPRKLVEARLLLRLLQSRGVQKMVAVYFSIPDEMVHLRASGRRVCSSPVCGQSYHLQFVPPQTPDVCDRCQSPLKARVDDSTSEKVNQRIRTFYEDTMPVVEFFQSQGLLITLNAVGTPSETLMNLVHEFRARSE